MKKDNIIGILIEKYKIQLILFFSILISKMLINLLFKGPTALNGAADEFGVISGAAFFGGNDWSNVTSHIMYYGWGYSLLMAPVFILFDNMSSIYQGLLFYNALLLALNAVVCYNILYKFFKIEKKFECALISVASVCIYNSMISNDSIINENPLIFLCWIILYIMLNMQQNVERNKSVKKLSVYLGLILCFGLTVHTRFLMIWFAVFIAIVAYYVFRKKIFVNIPILLTICIGGYFFISGLISLIQDKLWLLYLQDGKLGNSTGILALGFSYVKYMTSLTGLRAFFSCITGQLLVLAVYSGGIGLLFIVIAFFIVREFFFSCRRRLKKSNVRVNENNALLYTSILFIASLLIGTLLFGAIFSLRATITSLEHGIGTKWFVYQRYWAAYCGMAVMLVFVYLFKNRRIPKMFICITLGIFVMISVICVTAIFPSLTKYSIDASGAFTTIVPLMFRGMEGTFRNRDFIILAVVGILMFLIYMYLIIKKKYNIIFTLLLFVSLYCYGYGVINREIPLSNITNEKFQGVKWVLDDYELTPEEYPEIYTDVYVQNYTLAQFELNRYRLLMVTDLEYINPDSDDVNLLLTNRLDDYELMNNWSLIYSEPDNDIYLLVRNGELTERLIQDGKNVTPLNKKFRIDTMYYTSYRSGTKKSMDMKLNRDVIMEQNIYFNEEMLTGDSVIINLYFYNKSLISFYENVYISVIQGETEEVRCVSLSAIEHDKPLKVILSSSQFKSGEARIVLTCPEGIGKVYAVPYMVKPINEGNEIKEENKIIVNGEKLNQQLYYSIIKAGNNSGVNVANRILEKHDLDVISTKSYTNVTKELKINQTIYLNFDEKNDSYTNIGLEFIYNLIDMKDSDRLFIEISQGEEIEQFWYKKKHLENKNIIRVALDGKKFQSGPAEIKIYLKTQGETSVIRFMILREDYPGDLFSLMEHPLVKNGKLYPSKLLVNSYLIYNKHTAVRFPTRKSPKYY